MFFLSQNGVSYTRAVLDPWFYANGSTYIPIYGSDLPRANYFVDVMVCTDQYSICSATTGVCTTPGGINQLQHAVNTIGLNIAQLATARQLVNAGQSSGTYFSVLGLGDGGI
jgi:hypothetical protein